MDNTEHELDNVSYAQANDSDDEQTDLLSETNRQLDIEKKVGTFKYKKGLEEMRDAEHILPDNNNFVNPEKEEVIMEEEEEGIEQTRKSGGLASRERRLKKKKRVSWIDLEQGKTPNSPVPLRGPVTQVFTADSSNIYDRSPVPLRQDMKMFEAESKMDKLLITIIVLLVLIVALSFGAFVIMMFAGVIQQNDI